MTTKVWTGQAAGVAQVTHVTPALAEVGDVFTLTINGKDATYTVLSTDVADADGHYDAAAVNGLVAACGVAATLYGEFAELTFAIGTTDGIITHMIITGPADGTPFTVSLTATNGVPASVQVVETTKGYSGQNEVQRVQIAGVATGGTFTLTFNGETTAAIAYNASAATVEAALETLTGIDDVAVTGSAGGPWDVEFRGTWALLDAPLMTGDGSSITKAASGYAVTVTTTRLAVTGKNEIQRVSLGTGVTGGTFTLAYSGEATAALAYNITAANLKTALEALTGIDTVTVTQGTGYWDVEFTGAHLYRDVNLLVGDGKSLTGATGVAVTTTQAGSAGSPCSWDVGKVHSYGVSTGTMVLGYITAAGDRLYSAPATFSWGAGDAVSLDGALTSCLLSLYSMGAPDSAGLALLSSSPRTGTGLAVGPYRIQATGSAELRPSGEWGGFSVDLMGGDTGMWYNPPVTTGTDEIQVVSLQGQPSGGTFTLTFEGQTTAAIAYDADAATLEAALEALSNIAVGEVDVTLLAAGQWQVTFAKNRDVAQMIGNGASLTGAAVYAVTIQTFVTPVNEQQTVALAGSPRGGTFTLTFNTETTGAIDQDATAAEVQTALEGLATPAPGDVIVSGVAGGPWVVEFSGVYAGTNVSQMTGDGSSLAGADIVMTVVTEAAPTVNEVQTISLAGSPTGGTFTLTYSAETTGNIDYMATAAQMQGALEGLAAIAVGDIQVTGSVGGPWVVRFIGTLAATDVGAMTGDGTNLTTSGTQTLTQSTVTSPTGPNWWSDADNWSTGAIPATNDDVVFEMSAIPVKFGLDQVAVTPASITIRSSFAQGGQIGLPLANGTYREYRQRELIIGATGAGGTELVIDIGDGDGQGSDLIRLNTGTKRTRLTISQSAASAEADLPAICWRGSHVSNAIQINRGALGIAVEAGQTAVVATLQQGYIENLSSDSTVICGSGVTLGAYTKTGGSSLCFCGMTSLTQYAGSIEVSGAGAIPTVDIQGGTLYSSTTGELGKRGAITGITKADPAVVSSTAHGLAAGDRVRITGVVGMTDVNDREFIVRAVVTADSFSLLGCDSTGYGAWSSGGVWGKLGSVRISGDGAIDFSREMGARPVAVPIKLYGTTASVVDLQGVHYTETYGTTKLVLDYQYCAPDSRLPKNRRVIMEAVGDGW